MSGLLAHSLTHEGLVLSWMIGVAGYENAEYVY